MKKTALVICAHDGLTTYYCGVGTAASKTVEALKMLKKTREFKNFEFHFITTSINHSSKFFNSERFKETLNLARSTGGELHEIRVANKNRVADLNTNWGVRQWNRASKAAARIISQLKNQEIVFIAHDISFGLVCHYLPKQKNINGCYIPHSTGILFKEPYRFPSERTIYNAINKNGYKVGYINEFMKRHMMEDYHFSKNQLIPIKNALILKDRKNKDLDTALVKELKTNKQRILFAFGRCGTQKGYHTLIKAFRRALLYRENYQLILLAPTDITGPRYIKKLNDLTQSIPQEKLIWIKKFSSPLPFLRLTNLDIIALPSEFECAPFTAIECLRYAPTAKILYSRIEPFKEILGGLPSTFRVSDNKVSSWAKALNSVSVKKTKIRKVKLESYEKNLKKAIKILVKNQYKP